MPNKNVTIIAPDGTAGDVPSENVSAALSAGGKLGIHVYAPDGTPGYIPHDQLGPALKAGATYSPTQTQAPSDAPHGLMQSLVAPIPLMAKGIYHSFADAPRDAQEQSIKGTSPDSGIMARALGQFGLGGYRNLVAPSLNNAKAAIHDAQSPNLSDRLASASEAIGAIPILGQGVDAGASVIKQWLSGDKSGAVGSAIGNPLAAGLTAATFGEATKPTVNGTLTPLERSSVQVTKAVNPAAPAWPGYQKAVANQGINVLDYAKKNGLKITDARDFAKAAQLASEETQTHYTNNVLGPHVDTPVPLDGIGSELGDSATLGQVNERVNNITQDLKAGQRKPTPGQVASTLSGDEIRNMQREQGGLTDLLHRSLGDLNQMDPGDVAALRVRAGEMRTLAGETSGAANMVSSRAGTLETGAGPGLPLNAHGVLERAIHALQGGPEAIASRNVVKALKSLRNLDIAPSGLQDAYPQSQIPPSAADKLNLGIQQQRAQQAFMHGDALDTAAQSSAQQRGGVADYLRSTNTDIQKGVANQEFIRSTSLEQGAQGASKSRASVASFLRQQQRDMQAESLRNQMLNNGQSPRN